MIFKLQKTYPPTPIPSLIYAAFKDGKPTSSQLYCIPFPIANPKTLYVKDSISQYHIWFSFAPAQLAMDLLGTAGMT